MFDSSLPPRFTTVDGHKICYYRKGQGQPLLLVHGITTYSFIWRQMIPPLAKHFDVIAVDLLGCGGSDKPRGVDYSIKAQSRIIREVAQSLDLEKVHLVCHDIGGGIGQIMAVEYADFVIDLTLINTVAYDYWPVQPIITMRIPFLRQLAMATLDFGIFTAIVRRGIYHKDRVNEALMNLFWEPLRNKEGREGFLQLARCLNNRQLMNIAKDLQQLPMPVMIIRGDADPYLTPEIAERLHREIPGSQLEHIATGGHFIQEDEPNLLVDLLFDFFQDHK